MRRLVSMAVAAVLVLAGCGGGSGGGSSCTECASVGGTWVTWEEVDDAACGGDGYSYEAVYEVVQDGCALEVTPEGSAVTFQGSICGTALSWTGSYPEDGGTTRITSMSVTVTGASADALGGDVHWTWSGAAGSCSGITAITGFRE